MNKELEAWNYIKNPFIKFSDKTQYFNTIETALERLAELEDIFSEIKSEEAVVISAEKNAALEIIKNHKLMNYVIKNKKCANMYHLNDEEIEILKEVLL